MAAVPWLLHLLRRRRFNRTPFPSLMLLMEKHTMVWRRYRLEEIALLVVRTALVAALVAMLARPLVNGLPGWLSSAEQWVVLILDDSASMAAGRGDTTAMGIAKAKLAPMLKGLGPGARMAVIGGGRGNPVLAGFGSAAEAARAVADASPRLTGTDLAGALAKADRMLGRAKSPAIILASDFQRASFGDSNAPPYPGESGSVVTLVDAGLKPATANLVWASVKVSELLGRVTVEGRWNGPGPATISLVQRGRVVHQTAVAADSRNFAFGMELPPGDSACLRTWGDGLSLDDTFFLGGMNRSRSLCLVVAEAGSPGQSMLAKALESLKGAGYRWRRSAEPTAMELREASVILVAAASPSEKLAGSIFELAGPGRGVVLVPPAEADLILYNKLMAGLGVSARLTALAVLGYQASRLAPGPKASGQGWDARVAEAVQVRRYWKVSPGASSVLTIAGTDPGLVLEQGSGCRVALWLFGIDPSMCDLAYRPAFPVLLHRSLEFAGDWCPVRQHLTGDTLRLALGMTGEMIPRQESGQPSGAAGQAGSWILPTPGWYRIVSPAGSLLAAANLPADESDLERLPEPRLSELLGGMSTGRPGIGLPPARPAQPAWRALLLLSLLLLAAESALRMRLAGQKNG